MLSTFGSIAALFSSVRFMETKTGKIQLVAQRPRAFPI